MQKYLNQLLEDIEQAIWQRWITCPPHFYLSGFPDPFLTPPKGWTKKKDQAAKKKYMEEDSYEAMLEETETYTHQEPKDTMFYSLGFYQAQFPPVEKFDNEQLEQLVFAIHRLWAAFNFTASVPDNAPARIVYPLLLQRMSKPAHVMNNGHIGIEFCDYEPKRCPFSLAYCSCKVTYERMERETKERDQNVVQLSHDLSRILERFSEEDSFMIVTEFQDSTDDTLKTIAEWLDIDILLFPASYHLNSERLKTISQVIMALWRNEKEFIARLEGTKPNFRYDTLVQFLSEQTYYDGNNKFRFKTEQTLENWWNDLSMSAEIPYGHFGVEEDFWEDDIDGDEEDFPF